MGVICAVCFFIVNWPIIGLYYLPIERYPIDFQVYYKTNNQHKTTKKKVDSSFLIHFDSFVCRNFHFRFLYPVYSLPHSCSHFPILDTVFFSTSYLFILFLLPLLCFWFFDAAAAPAAVVVVIAFCSSKAFSQTQTRK